MIGMIVDLADGLTWPDRMLGLSILVSAFLVGWRLAG